MSLREQVGLVAQDVHLFGSTIRENIRYGRLRATDEGVPQALSGWRPTVSLQGDYGWDRTEQDTGARTSSSDAEYTQPRSGSLLIDQNLYRGGRTVAATRRAENTVKAERARLSASEQTILLDAVTAYMDVVRDEAIIDLNKNNVKVLLRQLEATRDRFRVGEVTSADENPAAAGIASNPVDTSGSTHWACSNPTYL